MHELNPYAPPREDSPAPAASQGEEDRPKRRRKAYWREGDYLIVRDTAKLPASVCLASGLPSTGELECRKLSRVSPWIFLALLVPKVGLFLLLLVYFLARQRAELTFALSEGVRRQSRQFKLAAWISLGVSALLLVTSPVLGMGWLSIVVFGIAIFFAYNARPLSIVRINAGCVKLKVEPAVFTALGL